MEKIKQILIQFDVWLFANLTQIQSLYGAQLVAMLNAYLSAEVKRRHDGNIARAGLRA